MDLSGEESTEWDLDDARHDLLARNFTDEEVETAIPARLKEWVSYLS